MAKIAQQKERDQAQFAVDMEKIEAEKYKIEGNLKITETQAAVAMIKAQTERAVHKMDAQLKHHDMAHRHLREAIDTHHKVTSKQKPEGVREHG